MTIEVTGLGNGVDWRRNILGFLVEGKKEKKKEKGKEGKKKGGKKTRYELGETLENAILSFCCSEELDESSCSMLKGW